MIRRLRFVCASALLFYCMSVFADEPAPKHKNIFDFSPDPPAASQPVPVAPPAPVPQPAPQPAEPAHQNVPTPQTATVPNGTPVQPSISPATAPSTPKPAALPAVKHQPPGVAKLNAAIAQVIDASPDLNSKIAFVQRKAARRLLEALPDDSKYPTEEYAALICAKNAFASLGDVAESLAIVDTLEGRFQIDSVQMRCDAAMDAGKGAMSVGCTNADRACAAPLLIDTADRAEVAKRFDLATSVDSKALTLAEAGDDPQLLRELHSHLRERDEARLAWRDADNSEKTSPGSAESRLAEGKALCLISGDWARGLSLLASGSDAVLAEAARDEQAGKLDMAADQWWTYAAFAAVDERDHPRAHRRLMEHLNAIYQTLDPSATALAKLKIKSRLATIADSPSPGIVHHRVNLLRMIEPSLDSVSGSWAFSTNSTLTAKPDDVGRLKIRYTPPIAYDLQVEFMRTTGHDWLDVYCSGSGRKFVYVLAANNNSVSGVNVLDGHSFETNASTVHLGLFNGRRNHLTLSVRPDSFAASMNDHLLYQRKTTDFSEFGLAPPDVLPQHDGLGLAVGASRFEFFSMVAVEIDERRPQVKPSAIKIVSADWGGGQNWSNVTARVAELESAHLEIRANSGTLGADPTPGWRKHLHVTYTKDGVKRDIWVDEDQLLKFPAE